MCFNADWWRERVFRKMLPPSLLCWRVRSAHAFYGDKVDGDSSKTLFNKLAWNKANSALQEALDGNASDPPKVPLCTHQLDNKGSLKKDVDGFYLCCSTRGANLTELHHKTLVSTCGTWKMGIECSDCLLMERNHRHNCKMSLKRRVNFPSIGHYDAWMAD